MSKHFEDMQIAQFSSCRIGGKFKEKLPPKEDFSVSLKHNKLESFFDKYTENIYIEGRVPGSNFTDSEIWSERYKTGKFASISAGEIQAGLINNLSEAKNIISNYSWSDLVQLNLSK